MGDSVILGGRFGSLDWIANRPRLERAILTAGVSILFVVGYFGLGWSTDSARAHQLTTSMDRQIPFLANWVWVYFWVFPSALSPLFVVRCRRLSRLTALAYAGAMVACLLCFWIFPVTSSGLRVGENLLDGAHQSQAAVLFLYRFDPPYNLFPSLHLCIAVVSAFSLWKASRACGAVSFVTAGLVAISVCTIKQHHVIEVAAGLALGGVLSALVVAPYKAERGVATAYSWPGPATFIGLAALFYSGLLFLLHRS